jgi:hypothetical protein
MACFKGGIDSIPWTLVTKSVSIEIFRFWTIVCWKMRWKHTKLAITALKPRLDFFEHPPFACLLAGWL